MLLTLIYIFYFLNGNLVSKMDKLEEQISKSIKKTRNGSKSPGTESIFKLLTMDAATNTAVEDTKEKIQLL